MVKTDEDSGELSAGGGIQSIEIGMEILATLGRMRGPQALSAIARECGMPRTKVYKYLVSFERSGFVEREPGSSHYVLGSQSLQLGLAALAHVDFVRAASAALPELCQQIGQTVFVAIWGENGPTIIRWEETGLPIALNVRVGSVMPLLRSATGQLFGAYLPTERTRTHLLQELAAGTGKPFGIDSLEAAKRFFADVRAIGLGTAHGSFLPGVESLAAPVFDQHGRLAGTITALGIATLFNANPSGPIASALLAVAAQLTERLGGNAPAGAA
jgi:DNA-binding IclR family transcriptional regulator